MTERGRWIAQDALSREILHTDVPFTGKPRRVLNAAGSFAGRIDPVWAGARTAPTAAEPEGRLILEDWRTLISFEASGQIRWSGLVRDTVIEGGQLQVPAFTHSTYLTRQPYLGDFEALGMDPVDGLREIWRHLQAFPDGNLGVRVIGSSPARLGTPLVEGERNSGPYELRYWEQRDCERELQTLSAEGPFEWMDVSRWNADRTDVVLETFTASPRIGIRRPGLRFVQGENITNTVIARGRGQEYANAIEGIGAGEGRAGLRATAAVRDGRLRRARVLAEKAVTSQNRLDVLTRDELAASQGLLEFPEITVSDHPHAPLGSFDLGDDVLVQAPVEYVGWQRIWHRIVAITEIDASTQSVELRRSDAFTYGSPA